MKQSKILSVLLAVLTACLVLSSSVAVPILCRPFYYAHIGPLGLVQATGLTEEAIRHAYDEMLDFCLGAPEFSTGALSWSQSGRDHFADVRVLFLLDLAVLGLVCRPPALWFLLAGGWAWCPAPFWAGAPGSGLPRGWGTVFAVVACWPPWTLSGLLWYSTPCSSRGRTTGSSTRRWTRSSILPEVFFRNCALLIGGLILLWCAILIGTDLWLGRRRR